MSGRRPTIKGDKAALRFLEVITAKHPALGASMLQRYKHNALLERVARVARAKQIKVTMARYRAACKGARSRKDLARRLGVTLEYVRKFEKARKISPTKKKRLAEKL